MNEFFLTPERHENSVEHGPRVVKEIRHLLVEADVGQLPVVALLAEGTHDEVVAGLARLDGDRVVLHGAEAVQEDEDADHGSRKEPAGIEP